MFSACLSVEFPKPTERRCAFGGTSIAHLCRPRGLRNMFSMASALLHTNGAELVARAVYIDPPKKPGAALWLSLRAQSLVLSDPYHSSWKSVGLNPHAQHLIPM